MEKVKSTMRDKYVVTKSQTKGVNIGGKMERNLQPEVVRIQAVKDSVARMDYVGASEAKRLLFEIEALTKMLKLWIN